MIAATFRRWRALRTRSRWASVLLAVAILLLVGVGLAHRWLGDPWPARVVLRAPEAAMPLAFTPDGRAFLTYGSDGITSWGVASGRKGATWPFKPTGSPEMAAFSPDGKTLAAAVRAWPGPLSIVLLDVTTGRAKATLTTPRRTIARLAFADDGHTLRAFLGDDPQSKEGSTWNPSFGADLNEAVTWDVATGRQASSRPLTPPTRGASTALSPDGRLLAISDRVSPAVQLWDLEADRVVATLANPATTAVIFGAGLGFSDDGRLLAIGRLDGTIEIWDVPGRRLVKSLQGHTNDFGFLAVQFTPGGKTLALTGYRWGPKPIMTWVEREIRRALGFREKYDAETLVLDVGTGRRLGTAKDSTMPRFSPDGKTLATCEPDASTRLRDVPEP